MSQLLKNDAILENVYRGSDDKTSTIAHAVSALCNLSLRKYPIRNRRS